MVEKMYKVEGYDKDNDVYEKYWEGNDLEKAKEIAILLDNIVEKGELCRYTSSGEREPIDWVQVSNENDEVVFFNNNENKIVDNSNSIDNKNTPYDVIEKFIKQRIKEIDKEIEIVTSREYLDVHNPMKVGVELDQLLPKKKALSDFLDDFLSRKYKENLEDDMDMEI